MVNKLYAAVATMVGYIIGAGILGIPYAVVKSGFLAGLISIIVLGVAVMLLNLYLGEVVLRTKEKHQLTGYAEKYLGNTGKWLMVFVMVFGSYGALIAYIIKEGQFLNALLSPILGGNEIVYSIIFFIAATYLVYAGIKAIEKSELFMVSFILIIVALLLITSFSSISIENLSGFNTAGFFIPFGVILFAFNATGSIPEIAIELRKNKKLMKKAIIIGALIPIIIYTLFTALVVGVTGAETTDGAILGVAEKIGGIVLAFGTIFGMLVLATSFIAIGLALKEMYMFDFRLKRATAATLACFIPLAIFFLILYLKIHNAFYKVIDITGSIVVPLDAILIVLMARKAKKYGDRKPEYQMNRLGTIGIIIAALFLIAFFNQIKNFLWG